MKKKNIILALVLLIVIVAVVAFVSTRNKDKTQETQQTPTSRELPSEVTIQSVSYTEDGFDPNQITIKKGESVQWFNRSSGEANVSSEGNTHVFLNLGNFPSNTAVQTFFNEPGTYVYYNFLNPEQKGTVIVE